MFSGGNNPKNDMLFYHQTESVTVDCKTTPCLDSHCSSDQAVAEFDVNTFIADTVKALHFVMLV